jgi:hypothetical protein
MTYIGTVTKKGTVALPPDANLPEGTKVEVRPVNSTVRPGDAGQWLLQFAGIVKDLPPDFAGEHDHYIHGTPKR